MEKKNHLKEEEKVNDIHFFLKKKYKGTTK